MKRLLCLAVVACGGTPGPQQSFAGLVRVSGSSPFAAGCAPGGQSGVNFPGAEVEPFVAVDPLNANHLVGVWQQDRWSNGGSNGLGNAVSIDGGRSWSKGFAHFTLCSGGNAANRATFQRASDPWVSFGADGTPHQIGFSFDDTTAHQAMLAVRSLDGGRTWTEPRFLEEDNDPDIAIDKESITADPADSRYVYAVWDRIVGATLPPSSPNATAPAIFVRTTDSGVTWEAPRTLYDPGLNAQTIGNQIVVLPDGTLLNLFALVTQLNQQSQPVALAVVRSPDKGATWSPPVQIAQVQSQGVVDPKDCPNKTCAGVRSGDLVPAIAVDRVSGALYVAWEDSRFTQNARDGIALSRSGDGGLTWSPPVRVNGAPQAQAFTPMVAVAQGGRVGVTYYDLRNDSASDTQHLLATAWLAVSADGGATFTESAMGGPFDLRSAARTAEGWFIGDYQGLVSRGNDFLAFFAVALNANKGNSDIFARLPQTQGLRLSPRTALRLRRPGASGLQ